MSQRSEMRMRRRGRGWDWHAIQISPTSLQERGREQEFRSQHNAIQSFIYFLVFSSPDPQRMVSWILSRNEMYDASRDMIQQKEEIRSGAAEEEEGVPEGTD